MIDKLYQPRLRMFAGPNGSGKSTMKSVLKPELLGAYINPDEIEAIIKKDDFLYLDTYGVSCTLAELKAFFEQSTLLKKAELDDFVYDLKLYENRIDFHDVGINSYWASVTADFVRFLLLRQHQSFTFETVMSSPDKIQLLQKAQELGYKTYLYYVATEDPNINIERVANRVAKGGHDVPNDKIISRYHRSLDLLLSAIKATNRAYLFDNSAENQVCIAEITNGSELLMRSDTKPAWFQQYILDKL